MTVAEDASDRAPRPAAADKSDVTEFRHTFVVAVPKGAEPADLLTEEFVKANQVSVLQAALNQGFHAEGLPEPEDAKLSPDGRSVAVTFVVPVHLASDGHPAEAVVPSTALADMGGSTSE